MNAPCYWVEDKELPEGRFLVPGCWNRALNGDDADCHCKNAPPSMQEQIDTLRAQIERMKAEASA